MASSLISNSHHVDFNSLFGMNDAALVQIFESLIATGLKEFLGCPAVFYEAAVTEFFTNGSVREDGMVVSTIKGTTVEISESMFAAAFELPTEGLTDLSDVPKNLVFDARSLFSESKEQVSISCLKKELKIQYRLLHDILEKTIYVKAGSFDSVTRDRFMLMTAITFEVKVNWSSLLFSVFKDMVTREATKEALSHQLLDFQSQAQSNYIILTDQLGQLVDYINRGGNDKKWEGESSRGPQPPPSVQIRDSGNAGGSGDAVRTTEITQADVDAANRQILERMMREDRERERERRSKSRSGSYKRRRY
ncbi:hypothetical protein F511_18300 [Dorcoceras hygrometricum]|uniref:Dystroglycan-like n=1 Tax=Dorcoceras hygrometricum TaxID=472368 RepID=A0A2Z7BNE3_9LAMI|nr:hypothetical protein F511_18300 [Dorcoceras hygrometricum]